MSRPTGDDRWYESDDPDRWFARGRAWVVLSVLLVGVIAVGFWGFRMATSDVRGRAEAEASKNAAGNRIAQQEGFQDLYNQLLAADRNLDNLDAARREDPSYTNRVNFRGGVGYCVELVGRYDAKAEKFTAEEFRDASLPKKIDRTDPETDCEITKKTETPR